MRSQDRDARKRKGLHFAIGRGFFPFGSMIRYKNLFSGGSIKFYN